MSKLTDQQKLAAVETYLSWDLTDCETAHDALDQIWWVVMEGRFKPDESH